MFVVKNLKWSTVEKSSFAYSILGSLPAPITMPAYYPDAESPRNYYLAIAVGFLNE